MWGKKTQKMTQNEPRHRISDEHIDKLRLSNLTSGNKARIVEVGGSEKFRIRLMEMGILVNDILEMDKLAPLQDPIEFIVKGYHLSLRRKDAEKIVVEEI